MTERSRRNLAALLFDALDEPVFGLDSSGHLVEANGAFREIIGEPSGRDIAAELGVKLEEGARAIWESPSGDVYFVSLQLVAEGVFLGRLRSLTSASPEQRVAFAREVIDSFELPRREEELIGALASICERLLPRRQVCVRLFEPDTGELRSVFATGRLNEEEREAYSVSSRGVALFGLPAAVVESEDGIGPEIRRSHRTIFHGTRDGLDVPLHDGDRLLGILTIESQHSPVLSADEIELVRAVALTFVSSLVSSRGLGESIYSRDYFFKLLDHANAPIIVTDRSRRVRLINRAFENLTGFARREVIGRDIKDFLAPEERERFLPAVVNALQGRTTRALEVKLPRREEGGVAHLSLSLAAVRTGFGEIEGVIAVGQDLTEVRKLQQQVIHSEKLATLGQLAAGVVHELNNPLTSISVYSEYLLRKAEREGAPEGDILKLRRICQGAERLLKFSRDLVAYARPTGEEPRLVELAEVVDESLVFCEHVIARAGVSVVKDYAPELPKVYGVKGQLQQIMVNLVTNACDAMAEVEGERRLRVSLRHVEDRVRMVVSDSGPGVPEEDRRKVFEPFYSTKVEGKGTGLGLSIVRNIITNHDGKLWVEESPEGGAAFVIELFAGP